MKNLIKAVSIAVPLGAAALLVAVEARADQCQAVKAEQAQQAAALLNKRKDVRLFCAPCKDKTATSMRVTAAAHVKKKSYDVVVATGSDGKASELDLAYTYVRMKDGVDEFTNVASLVGCPARGVPEKIDSTGKEIK